MTLDEIKLADFTINNELRVYVEDPADNTIATTVIVEETDPLYNSIIDKFEIAKK
jgi:hypothetical protein